MKKKIYDFAMIGHPGAGKTALVAGLYSVGSNFVAMPDEKTTHYLNDARAALQARSWPMATPAQTKLCLTVLRDHKHYKIRFDDYPGEKIGDDSFMREVVMTPDGDYPDGVLLLVNCAAEEIKDPQKAGLKQEDFKRFIHEMATNRVPVALVVTAWDRMTTDRRDDLPAFV